jgi:hypothetical protein
MRRLLLLVAVSFQPLASVVAQPPAELTPGTRVRLRAPGVLTDRYTGTVLSRTGDTLVVTGRAGASVRIPFAALTSLEVSRGKSRSRGALRGAASGAPIGGVALGLVGDDPAGQSAVGGRAEAVGAGVLAGGLWGALIGAIVGAERWERYDLRARTSLRPPIVPSILRPERLYVRVLSDRCFSGILRWHLIGL